MQESYYEGAKVFDMNLSGFPNCQMFSFVVSLQGMTDKYSVMNLKT